MKPTVPELLAAADRARDRVSNATPARKAKLLKAAKAATHGGARKGSGRPASGRKAYTVRLKPEAMRVLLARAKSKGLTLSEYLEGETAQGDF